MSMNGGDVVVNDGKDEQEYNRCSTEVLNFMNSVYKYPEFLFIEYPEFLKLREVCERLKPLFENR